MSWKKISSKTVYTSPYLSLREDQVIQPDGNKGMYNVLERQSFVSILALNGKLIYLVSQFRYPIQKVSHEIPQGTINIGEKPVDAARRELEEEIGKIPTHLEEIGSLYIGTGLSEQKFYVYIATGLYGGRQQKESTEHDLDAYVIPVAEFEQKIAIGEIQDSPTIASYGLYLCSGRKGK